MCGAGMQSLGQYLAAFPAPGHTAEEGGHTDWEGADYAIGDICDTLRLMRAQRSLLKCACAEFAGAALRTGSPLAVATCICLQ